MIVKITGLVNVWDVLRDSFTLGTPLDDVKIITTNHMIKDYLVDAMKNRDKVSILIEEAEE